MEYQALTYNLSGGLYQNLTQRLSEIGGTLTAVFSLRDAVARCEEQTFHLLVISPAEPSVCNDFIKSLRRICFMPVVILLDSVHADAACPILMGGADLCIPVEWPLDILTEHIMAVLRRYTKYNHYRGAQGAEAASFQEGDIYIDTARHVVKVRGRTVNLRPREFSLLLYFMQNSKAVLTAEKICEDAWGTAGIYNSGVAQPIRILRQAIEPDPSHPVYIETVRGIGYCFTAKKIETCE